MKYLARKRCTRLSQIAVLDKSHSGWSGAPRHYLGHFKPGVSSIPVKDGGWLSGHLNAYLRDDDEYRAITRQTIIRGLAGTITCTPAAITVTLEQPASRRVARALELLLDEINADPPAIPGDTRPINYQITPHRI